MAYKPPPYVVANNTPGRCGMIVAQCSTTTHMQAIVKQIHEDGCGWIWVGDPTTSYVSNHVPIFWQQEVEAIAMKLGGNDDHSIGGDFHPNRSE